MFPTISDAAVLATATEFITGTEDQRIDKLVFEYERVCEENPTIGEYLARIVQAPSFQNPKFLCTHASGFGLQMYRILEEEFKLRSVQMPLVDYEIGAPLQEKFLRDTHEFIQAGTKTLINEAPKLPSVILDWTFDFVVLEDNRAAQLVIAVGLCVYQFIKSQWEADELKASIGPKLG